jgi:membrane-bound lytic murein transglycosylase D
VPHPQRYTVRAGDTIVTVADRFNISVEELRSWNGLRSSALRPGQSVYVAEPLRLAPAGRSRLRVRSLGHGHTTSASHAATRSSKGHAKTSAKNSATGSTHPSHSSATHPKHKAG